MKIDVPLATLCSLLKQQEKQSLLLVIQTENKCAGGEAPVVKDSPNKFTDDTQWCEASLSGNLVKEKLHLILKVNLMLHAICMQEV